MAEKEQKGTNLAHLLAKSYTIEDKLKEDDRNSRRERYGGPTSTFTEKSNYVPNVQVKTSKQLWPYPRPVFPNLFWFPAPPLTYVDIRLHPRSPNRDKDQGIVLIGGTPCTCLRHPWELQL